jgi:RHS repeat-associated protein
VRISSLVYRIYKVDYDEVGQRIVAVHELAAPDNSGVSSQAGESWHSYSRRIQGIVANLTPAKTTRFEYNLRNTEAGGSPVDKRETADLFVGRRIFADGDSFHPSTPPSHRPTQVISRGFSTRPEILTWRDGRPQQAVSFMTQTDLPGQSPINQYRSYDFLSHQAPSNTVIQIHNQYFLPSRKFSQMFLFSDNTILVSDGEQTLSLNNPRIWAHNTGSPSDDLLFGDFDGNGLTDILVRPLDGSPLRVFLAGILPGSDAFSEVQSFNQAASGVPGGQGSVLVADFDGDGRADVLRVASDNRNQVFFSTGSAFVAGPVNGDVLWGPATIRVELLDLTGDGLPEVARFENGKSTTTIISYSRSAVTTTDVRLDGFAGSACPVALVPRSCQSVQGPTSSAPFPPSQLLVLCLECPVATLPGNVGQMVFGNFNGDHSPDFAIADDLELRIATWNGREFVALNQFAEHPSFPGAPPPDRIVHFRKGDFDGDGIDDVLSVRASGTSVIRLGAEGFRTAHSIPVPPLRRDGTGADVRLQDTDVAVDVADMDADGRDDIIIRLADSPQAAVLFSNFPGGRRITQISHSSGSLELLRYARRSSYVPTVYRSATCDEMVGVDSACGLPDLGDSMVLETREVQAMPALASSEIGAVARYAPPAERTLHTYSDPRSVRSLVSGRLSSSGFGLRQDRDLARGLVRSFAYNQTDLLRGRVKYVELAIDGTPLDIVRREEYTYENLSVDPRYKMIVDVESRLTMFEQGQLLVSRRTRRAFDIYGFPIVTSQCDDIGCTTHKLEYFHNSSSQIFGLPLSREIYDNANLIDAERYEYADRQLVRRERFFCQELTSCSLANGVWRVIVNRIGYDRVGNVVESQIATNDTTFSTISSRFDDQYFSFEVATTGAPGTNVSRTFDALGRVSSIATDGGEVAHIAYDAFGRVQQHSLSGGARTNHRYVSEGDPSRQHVELRQLEANLSDAWERSFFDGSGTVYRTERQGDEGRVIVSLRLHAIRDGETVVRATAPFFIGDEPQWTTTTIDRRGRVKSVLEPSGIETRYAYSPGLTTVNVLSPGGQARTRLIHKDSRDRTTKIIESPNTSAHAEIQYEYNSLGLPSRVTALNGPEGLVATRSTTSRFSYDNWGRRTHSETPETGLTVANYDVAGNLLSVTDAAGRVMNYIIDGWGRRVGAFSSGAGEAIDFEFAYGANPSEPGSVSRLAEVRDRVTGRVTKYTYDVRGLIVSIEASIPRIFGQETGVFRQYFEYDQRGRLIGKILPDGTSLNYDYSVANNLLRVRRNGAPLIGLNSYTASGRPQSRTLSTYSAGQLTDLRTRYDYDNLERLTSVTIVRDTEVLESLTYRFDIHGNISQFVDQRQQTGAQMPNGTSTQGFQYDAQDRLVRADAPSSFGSRSFAYDGSGNILVMGGVRSRDLSYNERGQAISADNSRLQFRYDDSGNLVERIAINSSATQTADSFVWGTTGQLRRITRNGQPLFEATYDHLGLRQSRSIFTTEGSVTRQSTLEYISRDYQILINRSRDAGIEQTRIQEIVELDAPSIGRIGYVVSERPAPSMTGVGERFIDRLGSSRDRLDLISPPADPLSWGVAPVGTWFTHSNHIGSVTLLTDPLGRVINRTNYFPFGELDANSSQIRIPLANDFTGGDTDNMTGLIYLSSRYYAADIGRFISPDPIVLNSYHPGGLNRYAYSNNNPVRFNDPSGHFSLGDIGNAISDGIGGVVDAVGNAISQVGSIANDAIGGTVSTIVNGSNNVGRVLENALQHPSRVVELPVDLFKAQEGAIRETLLENGTLRTAAMVAATVYGGAWGSAAFSAYMVSASGGTTDQALRAAVISGLTSYAFSQLGKVEATGYADSAARAVSLGAVGGASAAAQGGRFEEGFIQAFGAAAAAAIYEGYVASCDGCVRASPTYESGGEPMIKGPGFGRASLRPYVGNIGVFNDGSPLQGSGQWMREGSSFMRGVNRIPGMNSMAYFHDHMSMAMNLQGAVNVGTILVPAIPFNYYALGLTRDRYLLDQAMQGR